MAELKCPWQTVTTQTQETSYRCKTTVEFANCVKAQCPFWQEFKEVGCDIYIPEHCTRVKGE